MNIIKRPGLGRLRLDTRGAIALVFALVVIPFVMVAALAIDYGFFVQARSQLNLAADAAALQAVRVAAVSYSTGATSVADEEAAGQRAGEQWFAAQLGKLAPATAAAPTVAVSYQPASGSFSATVSYRASLPTNFGGLVPVSWPITGGSTSVVQAGYVEVLMLVDNSSSMLIGATTGDITTLEQATPCSTQSANEGQPMWAYLWSYLAGTGYSSSLSGFGLRVPPLSPVNGQCNPGYDGAASTCFYVPTTLNAMSPKLYNPTSGLCTNGGGAGPNDVFGEALHTPQAPCAFACHNSSTGNDYYGLARSLTNPATGQPVQLRLDVVHGAAEQVIQQMQSSQQIVDQFSVGYYEFNGDVTNVYPGAGAGEASTDLAAALTAVQTLDPPVTADVPNTDFTTSITNLAAQVTPAGNGLRPTTPTKALFIVTDGLSDTVVNGAQRLGPMTDAGNESLCQRFKTMGYLVYVLYTNYLPIPTPTYLSQVKALSEPSGGSALETALQACASGPSNYFEATSASDISAAMQSMLKSALATPGRVSH